MERLVLFILIALFAIIVLTNISRPSRKKTAHHTITPAGSIQGPGFYGFDIVGESYYQLNLETICGPKCHDGYNLEKTATVIPENNNPHDANAVRVEIDGLIVGHLNRDNALEYRNHLRKQKIENLPMSCGALIVGGWDRGEGNTGHFGVKLDLPTN